MKTPRQAVLRFAKSKKTTAGPIIDHNSFSSITVRTRPPTRVELWQLPAGRQFRVWKGNRLVGDAKDVPRLAKLLNTDKISGYCDACGEYVKDLVVIKQRGIAGLCSCKKCLEP